MFALDSGFVNRMLTIITVGYICYTVMTRMNMLEDRVQLMEKLLVKRHAKKQKEKESQWDDAAENVHVVNRWMDQIRECNAMAEEGVEEEAFEDEVFEDHALKEAEETDSVVMEDEILPPSDALIDMNQVALVDTINEVSLKKMSLKKLQSMCGGYNIEIMDGSKIKTKKKLIQEIISSVHDNKE
jgi:hypothetical protein